MGKYKENPKFYVISLRITDDERKALDNLAYLTRRNVSSIMREAFQQFYNGRATGPSYLQNGCLEDNT